MSVHSVGIIVESVGMNQLLNRDGERRQGESGMLASHFSFSLSAPLPVSPSPCLLVFLSYSLISHLATLASWRYKRDMAQRSKKNSHVKKIGLVTGGGDCPGLNAVIRAVVISAINRGWEVYGIERGFEGLLYRSRVHLLNTHDVRGIIHTGGTILGTTNRGNPFKLKDRKSV